MILQSLVNYYEALADKGEMTPQGWGWGKVSFALELSDQGDLLRVIPVKQQVQRGKKTVEIPQNMLVPEPSIRSANVLANFLCDHAGYILGVDQKGNPARTRQCFEASRALHLSLLGQGKGPAARAICQFFTRWDPGQATQHPALSLYWEELLAGANLVFFTSPGGYAHEDKEVRDIWNRHYHEGSENPVGLCLVTGQRAPIARLHGKIKGVPGAQSIGANLVSFNASAFESYGHDGQQGLNAPVSEYANFAYSTALNHLLADRRHRVMLGDTVMVYWSESANTLSEGVFGHAISPELDWMGQTNEGTPDQDVELHGIFTKLMRGENLDIIDPEDPFCVLGLSANASRLAVRFFLQDSFGSFLQHLKQHYERLEIVRAPFEPEYLNVPSLLDESVNPKSKNKNPSPLMTGSVMRAILSGAPYPESLYTAVMLRIRADQDDDEKHIRKITRSRAATIKACLMRDHYASKRYEEVLTVALNEQSNERPYVLGRLFAVLEKAQMDANPGINTTIKDRYFTSACATPGSVFPVLLRLASHHTAKAEYGYVSEREVTNLMAKLEPEKDPFPARLSLKEQGIFFLGYYHQVQARYSGKKNKEEQ